MSNYSQFIKNELIKCHGSSICGLTKMDSPFGLDVCVGIEVEKWRTNLRLLLVKDKTLR
jgi:hypothetical protein